MLNGWLRTIFSPWGKVILASFTASMALLSALPQGTKAAIPTVDLNILGFGSVPWSITNIKPGDNGSQAITLRNVGSSPGKVTVWLSNIVMSKSASVATKFQGAPQIDRYLTLNLAGNGVTSGLPMPAALRDFPRNAQSPYVITVGELAAGGEAELTWQWKLPESTGNDVQGDILSFDINYMIEETQPPPPPVVKPPANTANPVRSIQVIVPGVKTVQKIVEKDQSIAGAVTVTSTQKSISISFEANARIVNPVVQEMQARSDIQLDEVPHTIEAAIVTQREERQGIQFPEGWKLVSDIWEILGYTYSMPHHVTINPPAEIIIGYDESLLPFHTDAIALFYYNEETQEWIELQQPPGYIAQEGELAAKVGHFSIFAILAKGTNATETGGTGEPGTITPPAGETPQPSPQAKFEIKNLAVNPPEILVGEQSTITATVTNTGGMSGEYTATLTLDGKAIASTTVTLAPGESKAVDFNVSPGLPGTYGIEVNGLDGKLDVISLPTALKYTSPTYWWMVVAAAVAVILMMLLVRVRSSAAVKVATGAGAAGAGAYTVIADRLKEIHIVPLKPSIGIRTSIQLKVFARFFDGSEDDVTERAEWSSSAPATAEVLNTKGFRGMVFGHIPGTAHITARWSKKEVSTVIGVNCTVLDMLYSEEAQATGRAAPKDIETINVTPKGVTIDIGKTRQFNAAANFTDGSTENVTEQAVWTSTNDYVADIDVRGKAKGFTSGMTAIIATFRGKRGTTSLRVQTPPRNIPPSAQP